MCDIDFGSDIASMLEDDSYFLSRIFESIDQPLSQDTDGLHVIKVQQGDMDSEYNIEAEVTSNEVKYALSFIYDKSANDFCDVTYTVKND